MKPLGDPREHQRLVAGMARANGTDVIGLFAAGKLSSQDWAGMVERCRGCMWAEGCKEWLPDHLDGAAETPSACLNYTVFDDLKKTA
ncbi:DUF6455 family protein [Aestuariibius sp. 2305UL40-4]|uniref:DUF6455 family protein n=1 Tax=Aestuariibius violaceus TaxID=3234132 RepID=UPI00345E2BDB